MHIIDKKRFPAYFYSNKNDTTMYCNVGFTDRIVRITLGLLIIVLGFYFQSWLFLTGWILIASGLLEMCPIYGIFGISTSKEKKKFWA